MRELRPGVWHWSSPHPDWDAEEEWPEHVSSYGIELVLPAHGEPADRASLERVLA